MNLKRMCVQLSQTAILFYYCLYSANFAVCKSYFDSVGMCWAVGEDIFDNTFCYFSAPLVLLQDDFYVDARLDLAPLLIGLHFQSYVLHCL